MKINYTCVKSVFLNLNIDSELLHCNGQLQIWIGEDLTSSNFYLCVRIDQISYSYLLILLYPGGLLYITTAEAKSAVSVHTVFVPFLKFDDYSFTS